MKRKIEEVPSAILEDIMADSMKRTGIEATPAQSALLIRLFFSGISRHFFFNPDTMTKVGFINIQKSPDIDELFNVSITRSPNDNIVNADTLWQYYTGDMLREKKLRETLDMFVEELVQYAQAQEIDIMNISTRISNTKPNTRRNIKKTRNKRKKKE